MEKKELELYIHIPFCVKNVITVISFLFLQTNRRRGHMSLRCRKSWFFMELSIRDAALRQFLSEGHTFLAERRVYAGGHGNCISEFCCGWGCGDHDRV